MSSKVQFDDSERSLMSNPKKARKKTKYDKEAQTFNVKDNSKIKDGLVKSRQCTDLLCLILFIGFIGCLSVISLQCLSN